MLRLITGPDPCSDDGYFEVLIDDVSAREAVKVARKLLRKLKRDDLTVTVEDAKLLLAWVEVNGVLHHTVQRSQ